NNRYVRLTETGLNRHQVARRRYKATLGDMVFDVNTPSVNTIKRVLRQEPVFVSTLDRVWDYFQRCAADRRESLPYLIEGEDYTFVESGAATDRKNGSGEAEESQAPTDKGDEAASNGRPVQK